MATKIGTLQADLILKSANFIQGMKQSADATARATTSMSHGLHEMNKILKIAMGGGIAREFSHLFRTMMEEADKTSERFKAMHESIQESFDLGFGKGVDENLKVSNAELEKMDKNAHSIGETVGGAVTRGLAGMATQLTASQRILEDMKKGNVLETMIGSEGIRSANWVLSFFTDVKIKVDDATEAVKDYVNEMKKTDKGVFRETVVERTGGELSQQQAFNEALAEGLGDASAWEPVLSDNAKATERWNDNMEELAKTVKEYTDTIASGIADAVVEAKGFEESLKDITKQIAKMALTSALQSLFKIGTTAMGVPQVPVASMHSGGEVGLGGSRRRMPGAAWANAPRFHNGFMPGEFPAILQRGETVLTRQQMIGMRRGGSVTAPISIAIDARGADKDGLARVEAQLRDMQRTLPTQIIRTVRDAKSRRVSL
jgi:hypothetical protein